MLRLTAAGMALIAVCYGLARFAYGLFVPAFRAEFGLNDTLLGAIAALSYVGYCVAVLAAAAAVSRYGARVTATAAGGIAAAGMAIVATSPNSWTLAVGVLVAGSSTGVASPPLADAIARSVRQRARHDRAQAIVNAGPGVGIAVSGPIALVALGDWRMAWLTFAAIAAAVTVWVAVSVPRRAGRAAAGGGLRAVAGVRRSWYLAAGAGLFGAASAAVWTFARDHVANAGGLGLTRSTLLWVVLGVAELAGVGAGDVITRWGLRHVWMAGLVLLGVSTATIGVLPGLMPAAFPAFAIFGAAYVTLTTVVFLWAVRLHPDHPAAGVAFGFVAIAAGQAFAAPVVGGIADHAGATAAFLVCAVLSAAVARPLAPRTDSRDDVVGHGDPHDAPALERD